MSIVRWCATSYSCAGISASRPSRSSSRTNRFCRHCGKCRSILCRGFISAYPARNSPRSRRPRVRPAPAIEYARLFAAQLQADLLRVGEKLAAFDQHAGDIRELVVARARQPPQYFEGMFAVEIEALQ